MNTESLEAARAVCIPQETVLEDVKLAHAYVPFEKLCNTFSPMKSLARGTAFPPLYNIYGWERRKEVMDDE
ncbi:MAG: spore coat associated protein CotJA [Clostridiales bacterium]|jgi:hypothetical protein|nr:spore coat associated protein CotJA [Clostridiales bacterium]